MANPYIGEIRMVGFNFAPRGWALCNGALMPISENEALFSLVGTTYGGDGQSTFALPNLQSRTPIHQGTGPGLSLSHPLGELAGVETVTLTSNQMPNHTHLPGCNSNVGGGTNPAETFWAQRSGANMYTAPAGANATMNSGTILPTGGSQPHENVPPYVALNFVLSLFGVFPSQN